MSDETGSAEAENSIEPGMPGNPVKLTDPKMMRALAHPARIAIWTHIGLRGSVTATECAEVAGLSPSACSYHLRTLARYGFIEEDRASAAKCSACRCRTAGPVPDSASRATANVRIVSSMLNRLCSLPRVTTSQEESTSPRIRCATAGPAALTRGHRPGATLSSSAISCGFPDPRQESQQ